MLDFGIRNTIGLDKKHLFVDTNVSGRGFLDTIMRNRFSLPLLFTSSATIFANPTTLDAATELISLFLSLSLAVPLAPSFSLPLPASIIIAR